MAKLSDLLKNTLEGVSKDFSAVVEDLNNVVNDLNIAVSELKLVKPAKLLLLRVAALEKSAIYTVVMIFSEGDPTNIATFNIPITGYPISRGSYHGGNAWATAGTIADSESLQTFFASMLQNRSSPLVVQLAFAMNQS